jgi:hypothetical protein
LIMVISSIPHPIVSIRFRRRRSATKRRLTRARFAHRTRRQAGPPAPGIGARRGLGTRPVHWGTAACTGVRAVEVRPLAPLLWSAIHRWMRSARQLRRTTVAPLAHLAPVRRWRDAANGRLHREPGQRRLRTPHQPAASVTGRHRLLTD